jgi:chemotaxis protein methyltransferase CheR
VTAGAAETRFRELLARRFGWTFTDRDTEPLGAVLAERAGKAGMSTDDYLNRLAARPWETETTALIERLSITETYFFRHDEQFRALREEALPARLVARTAQRVLRMLSVACSSGEEAYSLAIAGRQVQPNPDWIISVLGVDANPAMLARAMAGRYSSWSLRETPEPVRRQWFRPDGDRFRVADEIRTQVQFRQHNVADRDDDLWQTAQYDVIFCRNLLMYLTPAVASALIGRMIAALAPGGYLFLGHTDSLGAAPDGLDLVHTHEAFYYCRATGQPPAQRPASIPPPPPAAPPPVTDEDVHHQAVTLLRDERFAEALQLVAARASDRPQDRLLHGVLLAQAGRFTEGTELARRLIDDDGLNADAHQLHGLCLEGMGAPEAAVGQYQLAVFLDPGFALARLRLGQLARRRGDDRNAARELERAQEQLAGERDERIMLFGGGFGRIALTVLCRSELDACGARR